VPIFILLKISQNWYHNLKIILTLTLSKFSRWLRTEAFFDAGCHSADAIFRLVEYHIYIVVLSLTYSGILIVSDLD
jgi:hypothetical protein